VVCIRDYLFCSPKEALGRSLSTRRTGVGKDAQTNGHQSKLSVYTKSKDETDEF